MEIKWIKITTDIFDDEKLADICLIFYKKLSMIFIVRLTSDIHIPRIIRSFNQGQVVPFSVGTWSSTACTWLRAFLFLRGKIYE